MLFISGFQLISRWSADVSDMLDTHQLRLC